MNSILVKQTFSEKPAQPLWYMPNGGTVGKHAATLFPSIASSASGKSCTGTELLFGDLIGWGECSGSQVSVMIEPDQAKAIKERLTYVYPDQAFVLHRYFERISARARLGSQIIGSATWHSDRGSYILERTDYNEVPGLWPGQVQYFAEFKVEIGGAHRSHVYAHVKWFKEYENPNQTGFPVSFSPEFQDDLWAAEWIPLHRVAARCCKMFLTKSCFIPCSLPQHYDV
jgi:hypothetical protein